MAVIRFLLPLVESRPPTSAGEIPPYLSAIAEWLGRQLGGWARQELFASVTWLDVILFLAVLLIAGVLDALVRFLIRVRGRRRLREERERARRIAAEKRAPVPTGAAVPAPEGRPDTEARRWLDVVYGLSRAPFSLVIWVYALYFGSYFLLREMRLEQPNHVLFVALDWLASLWGFVVLFWLIARIGKRVDERIRRLAVHRSSRAERIALPVLGRAARLIAPLVVVFSALPLFAVSPAAAEVVRTVASLGLIAAVTYLAIRLIMALEAAILVEFPVSVADNLHARKVFTRVRVLRKMVISLLVVLAVASMLMVFQPVRQLGASMLASAGLAGIVLGFAAQRSLATLVAGVQIALTQPIRVDDVVIVEGEWGRIEEITLTYVVVVIWDLRRLILPINYFIEKPFQNWTRTSANLLGTVFLYLDYTVPLGALREEVDRILDGNPRWDGKVKAVQVTDAKEQTVEVRILASARDAGTAFDLRCELREKLIGFVQTRYPAALPRRRAELKDDRPGLGPGARAANE